MSANNIILFFFYNRKQVKGSVKQSKVQSTKKSYVWYKQTQTNSGGSHSRRGLEYRVELAREKMHSMK